MASDTADHDVIGWNDAIRFWIVGGITMFLVAIVGNILLAAL